MLFTFVVRVVTGDGDQLAGHIENVETGAHAVFHNGSELVGLLQRQGDHWEEGRTS